MCRDRQWNLGIMDSTSKESNVSFECYHGLDSKGKQCDNRRPQRLFANGCPSPDSDSRPQTIALRGVGACVICCMLNMCLCYLLYIEYWFVLCADRERHEVGIKGKHCENRVLHKEQHEVGIKRKHCEQRVAEVIGTACPTPWGV